MSLHDRLFACINIRRRRQGHELKTCMHDKGLFNLNTHHVNLHFFLFSLCLDFTSIPNPLTYHHTTRRGGRKPQRDLICIETYVLGIST